MSQAFCCDKCGEVYKGPPSLAFKWHRVGQKYNLPSNGDIDLCPSCGEDFQEQFTELWEDE